MSICVALRLNQSGPETPSVSTDESNGDSRSPEQNNKLQPDGEHPRHAQNTQLSEQQSVRHTAAVLAADQLETNAITMRIADDREYDSFDAPVDISVDTLIDTSANGRKEKPAANCR